MKQLPWILAIVHATIALLIFGIAATSKASAGLPILIFFVDYPASLFARWLSELLGDGFGQTLATLIDSVIFIVIGSIWFWVIGFLFRAVFEKLKRRDVV